MTGPPLKGRAHFTGFSQTLSQKKKKIAHTSKPNEGEKPKWGKNKRKHTNLSKLISLFEVVCFLYIIITHQVGGHLCQSVPHLV